MSCSVVYISKRLQDRYMGRDDLIKLRKAIPHNATRVASTVTRQILSHRARMKLKATQSSIFKVSQNSCFIKVLGVAVTMPSGSPASNIGVPEFQSWLCCSLQHPISAAGEGKQHMIPADSTTHYREPYLVPSS